ncbi:sporulation membrane protein YtaF [Clostridium vincentii]|uniref:Manganese efflux pump MntP n=1 Tax=Clostridium vincentii TaxID=52704 RepID=A0A2T0BC41_9CLOT|nr:sporulation membrane protein YtaF [Clostridium vincentii]PRR81466.1 manganese efflux pump MntP [Clostridium vincentii]
MIQSLLLVSSVCIDAFVASIAYGTNRIKIPVLSAIIISFVGSLILGISLFFGGFIKDFLPGNLPIILSFSILMLLGIYRLFEGLFKNYIQKKHKIDKPLTFKLFDIQFVLQVYADETKADFDKSKTLTSKESFYLASALSFDSLAVGFGSSLVGGGYIQTVFLCLILGIIAVLVGVFIGKKLVAKTNINLSWLSGVILMILALNKLL